VLFDMPTDFEVDVELIEDDDFDVDVDDERTEDELFELLVVVEDFVVERSEDEELLELLVLTDFDVDVESVEDFEMLEDTDPLVVILLEAADDPPDVPFLM